MKWIKQIRLFFKDQRELRQSYKEYVDHLGDLSRRATIMVEQAKKLNEVCKRYLQKCEVYTR